MRAWIGRLRRLVFRRSVEREMDEELRLHLDLEIAERVGRGMAPDEARRTALADFGGLTQTKEQARDVRGVRPLRDLARDLRHAERSLRRTPVFSVAAVATIALGVGATAVVVSAVRSILMRPLPVAAPDELYVYSERWERGAGYISTGMAYPMYRYDHFREVRSRTDGVFEELAGFHYAGMALRSGESADMLSGMVVSPNFFRVLGLRPAAGRFFSDERDPGVAGELVISDAMWSGRFDRTADVLGRVVHVNSRPFTVIGVAPAGFQGLVAGFVVDAWLPATSAPTPGSTPAETSAEVGSVTIFGRLRRDLTLAQAEQSLSAIVPNLPPAESWVHAVGARITPLTAVPAMGRGGVQAFMGLLAAVAGLMLLLTGANVAGMLLARASHRRREIAVRLAIGARRGRVMRHLLTESLALGLAGAIPGVVGAVVVLAAVSSWFRSLPLPGSVTIAPDVRMDPVALALSVGIAMAAAALAGLAPALEATRVDVLPALRGLDDTRGGRSSRLRRGFVIAQVGLSLALLATAGLFVRALQRSLSVDPGFDPDGVVVAGINLGNNGYAPEAGKAFYEQLLTRLAARPEFTSVSLGRQTPLGGSHSGENMIPEGEGPADERVVNVTWGVVDTGYFATVRAPLVEGRSFTALDAPGAPLAVIINQTAARRFWPGGGSALGRRARFPGGAEFTVVGVVRDGRYRNLDEEPLPFAYLAFAQHYGSSMRVFVRTSGDIGTATAILRREVAALDPNVALERPRPLAADVNLWRIPQRIASALIGAFGLAGLLLAAIGVYGVLAYHVARRVREFGIRMALGARAPDLTRSVLREGALMLGPGMVLGLGLAAVLARPIARFLYGIDALDPLTLIAVSLALVAAAAVASYLPARRASRVDPMISLRAE